MSTASLKPTGPATPPLAPARATVVIVLDTSIRTRGLIQRTFHAALEGLSAGLRQAAMNAKGGGPAHLANGNLEATGDVALVTAGGSVAHLPFSAFDEWVPPLLLAEGQPALGDGIAWGLDLLAARRRQLAARQVPAGHDLFLLLAGGPFRQEDDAALLRLQALQRREPMLVAGFTATPGDMPALAAACPLGGPGWHPLGPAAPRILHVLGGATPP